MFSSDAGIMIKEVISIMPDVKETVFFSDGATIQLKNRSLVEYLMMMEANDLEIIAETTSLHPMGRVVDSVDGKLKRLVFGALQLKNSSSYVIGKRQQRLFVSYNKLNSMGKSIT